jgi:signal transduction histidine kinase
MQSMRVERASAEAQAAMLERAERRQRILVEAGEVLTSSLDYAKTLTRIARLVVDSGIADMCIVDMLENHGSIVRLTVAHRDPSKAAAAAKLAKLALEPSDVLARTSLATGQPQIWSEFTDEFLVANATKPEHLAVLRELGPPRSAITTPIVSPNGVIGALLLASMEPRHFQPDDLSLAMELAHRAALAIENARLYEAARQATKVRDEALAIVVHDVRNPIATIQLAATTLERFLAHDEPRIVAPVQMILRASRRANRLIQDLLDITRIEGAGTPLALEQVEIAPPQLIAEVLEAQRLLAAASKISLDSDVSDELPPIVADRHRLLQVFENLIGNAMKFTPRGGHITIGAAPRERVALFWVADNGPGVARENLEHIFDRFWQVSRADRQGAGLGLPICRGIVEAHGGRIWAESELGRGTTFFFTIPEAR